VREAEIGHYREILPLLNGHRARLLDHPRLVTQLCSLERRTARGGRDSIDHPPMQHDDVANAAAGALLMVGSSIPTVTFSAADLARASMPAHRLPRMYG
jgi:hypothetical protein